MSDQQMCGFVPQMVGIRY